jgi:ABC-2 type transport system ATP-binding protein
MEEADRADRVAILEEGRIVAIDAPDALKANVGHEVLVIQCDAPTELQKKLADRLSLDAQLIDGDLRIEASNAHCLVGSIMDSFGAEVRSLSVGRPTLEDAFVHLTGHHFWSGATAE